MKQLTTRLDKLEKKTRCKRSDRGDALDCIAPCYYDLHRDIASGLHTYYYLPGGRGSCKSSFASIEIVSGMMINSDANAIVFRRVADTLRESVFSQIAWAIEMLGVSDLWRGSVSPLRYTYLPTGQSILFRGLDHAEKIKSAKAAHGYFKYIWFEELSELPGENTVRSVLQSVMRGKGDFVVLSTFNPPISLNSWVNQYVAVEKENAITFRSDYRMIPPDWLGAAFLAEAARLKEINEQAYRHEYLGEAVGSGGEVFPNLQARTISAAEIKQMDYFYCGLDFGFAVDPAAFIRCSFDRKTDTLYLLDEIYRRGCSNADLAQLIKEGGYHIAGAQEASFLDQQSDQEDQLIIADSAEPKSIADLREAGLLVIACKKYAGSVSYGIKWLQHRRIVIDPARTPEAWREFSNYQYQMTKDGTFLASVPDQNNHLIDATRYALDRLINRRGVSA